MSTSSDRYVDRYVQETIDGLRAPYVVEGIAKLADLLVKARADGRMIFFFGNGGSAATSSHMAQDLEKLTIVEGRPRFRTFSLPDRLPLILAWANDKSFADVFVEQIKTHGTKGDVAIGISGSGNSPNVLRALEEARKRGMSTVGLIGTGGGKMAPLCDLAIVVPSSNMQHIEDFHHILLHLLASYLRDECPP
jgi:D-sedoheptulose 7-phosphate isomerase